MAFGDVSIPTSFQGNRCHFQWQEPCSKQSPQWILPICILFFFFNFTLLVFSLCMWHNNTVYKKTVKWRYTHSRTHLSYQAYSDCRRYSDHRCMFSQHSGMCLALLCECPGSSVSCGFNHLFRSLFRSGTREVDNTYTNTHTHATHTVNNPTIINPCDWGWYENMWNMMYSNRKPWPVCNWTAVNWQTLMNWLILSALTS